MSYILLKTKNNGSRWTQSNIRALNGEIARLKTRKRSLLIFLNGFHEYADLKRR